MATSPILEQGPRETLELPEKEISIPAPGPAPSKPAVSLTSLLLPIGFTVVGLVVIANANGNPALLLPMAIMMLGSYAVSLINYWTHKRAYQRAIRQREARYTSLLGRHRQELLQLQEKTGVALCHSAPDPSGCLGLVERLEPRRLWARAPDDNDYLELRLGLGARAFQVTVKPPEQPSALDPDPLIQQARDLAAQFGTVAQVPICLSLRQAGVSGLAGPRQDVLNAARSLVIQLATHHSPHDVKIVAIYPAGEMEEWQWLRWLPHAGSDDRRRRFLACERDQARALLAGLYELFNKRRLWLERTGQDEPSRELPHYVFLLAEPRLLEQEPIYPLLLKSGPTLGAYPIFTADRIAALPRQCQGMVRLGPDPSTLVYSSSRGGESSFVPDRVSLPEAERLARALAPIRVKRTYKASEIPVTVPLLDALGVERVEDLDILKLWDTDDPCVSMAVPVGRRAGGELQYLDLHERKGEPTLHRGHGPNALVAGTVGSGKSELVQALVASLAVHFHPHQVAFVLLDFKPPGMARALEGLPHVVNTIDLDKLDLVPRALKSLDAELSKRGRLFKQAGVTHIDDYMSRHRKHDVGALEPLPYLVLIVDEFTVLRDHLPETMQRFVQVAIRGRAFGFRMILATQKPAGVVSPQIESNTELRLCLRVAKPEDSQEMIKRPDAARLAEPGRAYMRVGEDAVFELFQSAWSGAPYAPEGRSADDPNEIVEVALDGSRHPLGPLARPVPTQSTATQLGAVVSFVCEVAERQGIGRLKGPWVEPLSERFPLEEVRLSGGWDGCAWQPTDCWLQPAIGLVDDPENQCQSLLQPDLGRSGHLFICSGPGSDHRVALRTLIASLAMDHSPAELHIYCLDFGSLGLQVFDKLPHVGAIIRKDESRRVQRLLRWLAEELDSRKRWLAQHRAGSLAESHARDAGSERPAALLVVVDNLAALREDHDALDALARLARRPDTRAHRVRPHRTGRARTRCRARTGPPDSRPRSSCTRPDRQPAIRGAA